MSFESRTTERSWGVINEPETLATIDSARREYPGEGDRLAGSTVGPTAIDERYRPAVPAFRGLVLSVQADHDRAARLPSA